MEPRVVARRAARDAAPAAPPQVAMEALKVAEFLTPELTKALA